MQPRPWNQELRFKSPGHLGSWFLGPGCIELKFSNADLNARVSRFSRYVHIAFLRCVPLVNLKLS